LGEVEVVGSERAAVAGWAEEEMEVVGLATGMGGVVAVAGLVAEEIVQGSAAVGSEKQWEKAVGIAMAMAWQMQVAAAWAAAQRTCSWRLGRRPLAWTERRFVCFPCRMRSCQGWSGWSTAAQH